jgi:hypothetical protein
MYIIFDIESDGLLNTATKIHCLCYSVLNENFISSTTGTCTTKFEIEQILEVYKNYTLVGHNIIRFDIPMLNKFGIEVKNKVIDTLGLSWYLYSERRTHNLEDWGEHVGIAKPDIKDWSNLSQDEYIHRCTEDVKINSKIFLIFMKVLNELYEGSPERMIRYINFKLECLREQEEQGIDLDVYNCSKHLNDLEFMMVNKMSVLSEAMPNDVAKILKSKPKIYLKKDGTLSSHAIRWEEELKERNLPIDSEVIYDRPNPGSVRQLKIWLFRLGWEPITFTENEKGEKVPQINVEGEGGEKILCESVKVLFDKEPALEELDSLFKIRHRSGILKGFLEFKDTNNKIYSVAHGFTNTMRFKHSKPINYCGL